VDGQGESVGDVHKLLVIEELTLNLHSELGELVGSKTLRRADRRSRATTVQKGAADLLQLAADLQALVHGKAADGAEATTDYEAEERGHVVVPQLGGEHAAQEQVGEATADKPGQEQNVLVNPVLEQLNVRVRVRDVEDEQQKADGSDVDERNQIE